MTDQKLPQYNRKTTLRVKLTDKLANVGIRTGGLGVVFAVLGLIVFIAWQVVPLFGDTELGHVVEPVTVSVDKPLLLHTDEYRRIAFTLDEAGFVTFVSTVNGEVISRFKPAQLGDSRLTAAYMTMRSRTDMKVGSTLDVPHHHLLLGTDDGRVFVARLGYLNGFLNFELGKDPADLAALKRPEDDDFTKPHYVPDVLVKDGAVVEHLPTFGLYRTIKPLFEIERRMDVDTGKQPIKLLAAQINHANADSDRDATAVIITADGRTRLVTEKIEVNAFSGEMEATSRVRDLTDDLSSKPDFVLVNELQDRVILADKAGVVHYFGRRNTRAPFELQYSEFSIFEAQADDERGRHWRHIIEEEREDAGLPATTDKLELTAMNFLLGDTTVIFGDSRGGLQSWINVIQGGEGVSRMQRIRTLTPSMGAVTHMQASPITKAMIVVDAGGGLRAINNTAENVYVDLQQPDVSLATFNRKGDGMLALDATGKLHHWWIDAPHSEVSWTTLFGKVWYEGYSEPKYEWQSTGGTDDVEPKLSLMPLVRGTIKGALYALVFAIPLGVLAAIYTSEFMHRRMRAIFKPTMEVMASLPSVVLGFLAALYFAPKAAPIMPTILVALVVMPGVFMVFGWLWQRFPPSVVGRVGPAANTALLFVLLFTGIWISSMIGPRAEVLLFPAVEGANPAYLHPETFEPLTPQYADELAAGDFRTWTGGGRLLPRETEASGRTLPKGWWIPGGHNLLVAMLAIPLALLAGFAVRKLTPKLPKRDGLNPIDRLRDKLEGTYKAGMRAVLVDAAMSLGFAALMLGVGVLLSLAITPLVELIFFSYDHPTAGRVADFRRWATDILADEPGKGWRFEQSNSLIVGFAMGFAVIPLIYTISEDALSTVPNQLRAASLACGASRWQTTTRVVLPAAASGIFSGIVIGLGRALGETMIVVMAAGGTPVMEMQPLNGFRSLSAAIAIEMPEAPHSGTLYRTLFMGGLLLFIMAFTMNTLAELVRMRLRKRLSRL